MILRQANPGCFAKQEKKLAETTDKQTTNCLLAPENFGRSHLVFLWVDKTGNCDKQKW
jgi:hypothetical protein